MIERLYHEEKIMSRLKTNIQKLNLINDNYSKIFKTNRKELHYTPYY